MNKLIDKYANWFKSTQEELQSYIDNGNNNDNDPRLLFLEVKVNLHEKSLNSVKSIADDSLEVNDHISDLEEWKSKLQARIDSGIADSGLEKDSSENKIKMTFLKYDVGLLTELISDLKKVETEKPQS